MNQKKVETPKKSAKTYCFCVKEIEGFIFETKDFKDIEDKCKDN